MRKNRKRRPLLPRVAQAIGQAFGALRRTTKVLIVVGLIVALPVGLYEGYQALMRSSYFMVATVRIQGNERVSRTEVLALAGLDARRNIFGLDTERMQGALESNPWIESAEVELDLPRTVNIAVHERVPAGWVYWNGLLRVDESGRAIVEGRAEEIDGPLITGLSPGSSEPVADEAAERDNEGYAARVREALGIAAAYEALGLGEYDELVEIHFDELLGFSLLTRQHGVEVRLGNGRYEERLARLGEVYHRLDGQNLLGHYILLDGEGDLTRVAVGSGRPGRDLPDPTVQGLPLHE